VAVLAAEAASAKAGAAARQVASVVVAEARRLVVAASLRVLVVAAPLDEAAEPVVVEAMAVPTPMPQTKAVAARLATSVQREGWREDWA
jgi:hypothetical protein